jgi:hypothetical protein
LRNCGNNPLQDASVVNQRGHIGSHGKRVQDSASCSRRYSPGVNIRNIQDSAPYKLIQRKKNIPWVVIGSNVGKLAAQLDNVSRVAACELGEEFLEMLVGSGSGLAGNNDACLFSEYIGSALVIPNTVLTAPERPADYARAGC